MSHVVLDPVVLNVNVSVGATGVTGRELGTMLVGARDLGVGFTERVRRYFTAAEAAADTDLSQEAIDAVADAFAQPNSVSKVAVGRIEDDVEEQVEFLFAGTWEPGETATITINGTDYTHTAGGVPESDTVVAAAMQALVDADPDVTATVLAETVTVTAIASGGAFTYSSSETAATGTITEQNPVAPVNMGTELMAMAEADPDWYGLTLTSRVAIDIQRAAAWISTTEPHRIFYGQSSDADLLTTAGTSIADTLKTLSYNKSRVIYHPIDTEYVDAAELSAFLSISPDVASTTSAFKTLTGITPTELTATQLTNLLAKNAGIYSYLQGVGATYAGRMASGILAGTQLSADWVETRIKEGIAALLIRESMAGRKVPMSDAGIQQVAAVMRKAVEAGWKTTTPPHFLSDDTGTVTFNVPLLKDVPPADQAAGKITMSFTVRESGEIQVVDITGTVTTAI